ncbi:thiazole biosynthesis adenylyltransferase ThiF [Salirhabdus salicampi]|uniref:thiazole biosynthesis adenylyltransferase ThiF n=1 Tax=Salirhabdus salicampi TaxID=476102 RepID=UPI0020C4DEA1|nr:thiazole biosynthesis adenylyltransferase ThiF [Salirhabdus salicampi]MCP8616255.1 thiazole biosynthesis adenylyltransferase ThiF [Salirhabdus salicampi]
MTNRYSRQERFTPIGEDGQQEIQNKTVLIVGAGALGTGSAEALVRAGTGKVIIADRDYVEWSNLQRQQLYCEEDAKQKMPKAIAAQQRLEQVNSDVHIESLVMDITVEEMEQLVSEVDIIIDATDNFDIRMIINDISQKYRIPWIYGACVGSYGISYTILPGETPCLQCLLDSMPFEGATCDTVGIISPAVQMVVSYQVTEALKILIGDTKALRRKLISFDLWKNQQSGVQVDKLKKDSCSSCGSNRTYPFLTYENQMKTAVLCGRDTVQIRPAKKRTRTLSELAKTLTKLDEETQYNSHLLSCTIEDYRIVVFQDGRTLVHGTNNISEAKSIYHRYIG